MDNNQKKAQMRLSMENKYKNVIGDVDLDVEELLFKLNNEKNVDHELIQKINRKRLVIIERINSMKNFMIEALTKDCISYPRKNCMYLSSSFMNGYLHPAETTGLLLITDFYVSLKDIKFLK